MRIAETNSTVKLVRQNLHLVKRLYPGLRQQDFQALRSLTRTLHLCVLNGEILYIEGKWYVTHAGLLQIALRRRCLGIRTALQEKVSDSTACRWVFKATVYKSPRSRGFVGYGDADPSNVSSLVHGAEMRVAETRAVNRALRKAYGIGLCSVEELGWAPRSVPPARSSRVQAFRERKQWPPERSASPARSSLPADPPAPARCQPREGLCRRLLRNPDPA